MSKELVIQNISTNDIWNMAGSIAKSGLFGMKNQDQAMALMLIAQAEGMHPALAARDYHVIQGKPALKADSMLARFQNSGGKFKWLEYTDTVCKASFSHPEGGKLEIEWTIDMAKRAKLTEKKNKDGSPNNWIKYPRQMLSARVISEGVRKIYPNVLNGMYTPEEIIDFEQPKIPIETECTIENEKPKEDQVNIIEQIDLIIKEAGEDPDWTKIKQIVNAQKLYTDEGKKYLLEKHTEWTKSQPKEIEQPEPTPETKPEPETTPPETTTTTEEEKTVEAVKKEFDGKEVKSSKKGEKLTEKEKMMIKVDTGFETFTKPEHWDLLQAEIEVKPKLSLAVRHHFNTKKSEWQELNKK
jgi:hypothetical protein